MILDKKRHREYKLLLIDYEKTIHKVVKCPHCNDNLKIYEVITSSYKTSFGVKIPELNEIGYWVEKCKSCNNFLKIKLNNPDLLKNSYGCSNFYGFFIDEDFFEFKDNIALDNIKEVEEELVDKKIFKIDSFQNYNFNEYFLYFCGKCNNSLEVKIFDKLKANKKSIFKEYSNYINWSLASRGYCPKYVVVKLNIECDCGEKVNAFLYDKYKENLNINLEDSILLANVTNTTSLDKIIQGVFTKTDIMNWLYKLLVRWNLLFDTVYLISPFVGHQFLKKDKIIDTWTKIFKFLDPDKSKIIVRGSQLTYFKKSFNELNDVKYEDLVKFNIGSRFINESKSNNKFHAKFFCGIKKDRCEVMSGSSNLVEGVSYEVINFNTFYNNEIFFKRYLEPLGLDNPSYSNDLSEGCSLFFDEDNDFKITHDSHINKEKCSKIIFGIDS
ncbi:phospholipase D family protein [Acinetobacter baumannii]|uniref:phospholipase D family protein n=1 Tax=Acinetobacter baumannii TaxID=470 RepID=UPI0002AEAE38|nr:phospholipase D family protein [Acinetobacter baumannii]ELW89932.1 hypothetical protein ACINAA014_2900 [Acinetobacter baumannii AA-014]